MDASKIMDALRRVDEHHIRKTPLSSIDSVSHLIVTLSFIITVLSFQKYELSALVPFIFFPVAMLLFGDIPVGMLLRRVAAVMPAVLLLGAFNPVLDERQAEIFGFVFSMGWVSLLSLTLKCALTVTAALALVCVTGADGICDALRRLHVPKLIVSQFGFTYRYIHTLGGEAVNMLCAYRLRAPKRRFVSLGQFAPMTGSMFLRSLKRAEDIYAAMRCRGFNGVMPVSSNSRLDFKGFCYILLWMVFFIFARIYNLPQILGNIML